MHTAVPSRPSLASTKYPMSIVNDAADMAVSAPDEKSVGNRAQSTLSRRLRYVWRFVFWTVRHRSTEHVRWVLAHEGTSWN